MSKVKGEPQSAIASGQWATFWSSQRNTNGLKKPGDSGTTHCDTQTHMHTLTHLIALNMRISIIGLWPSCETQAGPYRRMTLARQRSRAEVSLAVSRHCSRKLMMNFVESKLSTNGYPYDMQMCFRRAQNRLNCCSSLSLSLSLSLILFCVFLSFKVKRRPRQSTNIEEFENGKLKHQMSFCLTIF